MITSICRSFFVVTSQLPWGQKRLWILRLGMVVWSDGAGEILAPGLVAIPWYPKFQGWQLFGGTPWHATFSDTSWHIMTHPNGHENVVLDIEFVSWWLLHRVDCLKLKLHGASSPWLVCCWIPIVSICFNLFELRKRSPLSWCNWWYHGSKSIWFPAVSSLSIIH